MFWTIVILLVLGSFASFLLHEASHAAVAKAVGAEITQVKLWPHKHKGHWRGARIQCKGLGRNRPFFYVAPLAKVGILYLLWLILGVFVWHPLLVLIIPELFDTGAWFKGYFFGPARFDGARFKLYTN
jgi:hypothetical protein